MPFYPRGSPERGPLIMGILNVTPDSFSDGGRWADPSDAVAHALEMANLGADIIDVGAESTRPGGVPVSVREEMDRLKPVLKDLIPSLDVPISVDTMKTEVAEMCVSMGAEVVNDVNGLRDVGMVELCASTGVYAVIMHMPGSTDTVHGGCMGDGFVDEILGFLRGRTGAALDVGMSRDRIIVDPGIGFGKTVDQNMWIVDHSSYFSDGFPVLSGSSRKKCIATGYPGWDIDEASADAARRAWLSGADIVRVHNVAATCRAIYGEIKGRRT